MGRIIPNENTWIAFSTSVADISAPTAAELTGATDLTCFTVSINASATGNTVPTPSLCSTFETSINGTVSATFQGDFYRDDASDTAWDTLPRGTEGFFLISRFGGTGTGAMPASGQTVEVWPVVVTSRQAGALSSNTTQMFSLQCAVNVEPSEDATVVA